MKTEIKTEWRGVEIVYNEKLNKWRFDVRGRERLTDSLEAAKALIDKPEPKEKVPFERVEAWYLGYGGDEPQPVTITSVAIPDRYTSAVDVWITKQDDAGRLDRRKVRPSNLYPKSPHNDVLIKEIETIEKRKAELAEARSALAKKLKSFVIPNK